MRSASLSTQTARCPMCARHAPVTIPTYPTPTTPTSNPSEDSNLRPSLKPPANHLFYATSSSIISLTCPSRRPSQDTPIAFLKKDSSEQPRHLLLVTATLDSAPLTTTPFLLASYHAIEERVLLRS